MTRLKAVTNFEELELFPLDGYESNFSYFLEQLETENSIIFNLTKKKRDSVYIKKWDQWIEDKERLIGIIKQNNSFFLELDNEIIGVAITQKYDWNNTLNIEMIEIKNEYRKMGFGTIIMKEIDRIAQNNKVRAVTLETQTANGIAIEFYKKNGYNIEGIDISLYTNEDIEKEEIALIMKKRIKNEIKNCT